MGLLNPKVSVDRQTQTWINDVLGRVLKSVDNLTSVLEKKEVHAELHIESRKPGKQKAKPQTKTTPVTGFSGGK